MSGRSLSKIDVIYPVGTKSAWNDNELRYSIRSVVEFVNINNIIIVGHKPDWLSGEAIHLNVPDLSERKKGSNIIYKTIEGAKVSGTDKFLRLSDDHVILNLPDFSPYHRGSLNSNSTLDDSIFERSCHATHDFLKSKGLPTLNYEGHYPVIVDRERFIKAYDDVNLWNGIGHVINSVYFNQVGEFPPEPKHHVLRQRGMNFDTDCIKYIFLNYNDFSLSEELKSFLQKRFPNPTIYERG